MKRRSRLTQIRVENLEGKLLLTGTHNTVGAVVPPPPPAWYFDQPNPLPPNPMSPVGPLPPDAGEFPTYQG